MAGCYSIRSRLLREMLAEFLGTFILGSFIYGAATQNYLGEYFNPLQQNIAVGIGVMVAIYICGDVSGAHLNPALTLAYCLEKRTPWKKLPCYWLVQITAAFVSAEAQFELSYDFLHPFDGGSKNATSAAIFISYPAPLAGEVPAIFNQIFATFILTSGCLAMTDKNNAMATPITAPIAIGLLVTALCCSFGLNGGPALNPAFDLAPRIVLMLAGWRSEPFRNYNWFCVTLFGPLLGSFLGWVIYKVCISQHRISDDEYISDDVINRFEADEEALREHSMRVIHASLLRNRKQCSSL